MLNESFDWKCLGCFFVSEICEKSGYDGHVIYRVVTCSEVLKGMQYSEYFTLTHFTFSVVKLPYVHGLVTFSVL